MFYFAYLSSAPEAAKALSFPPAVHWKKRLKKRI
jgi:hypothetical protein